ncbi:MULTISPECIES: BLUF domain-containing protein [Sphingobium]|uniref:BLUF domain-containing protein n=1 Tax=Sphingobium tyrosinilyticum TaxID=2715436 RepID=A0ABV9F5Y2_9SPHN|nr:BLUF domain-containing protein [Sphingobium sp. EP60837]ANI78930.1 Blue light- and temperature-regulated antirepressor BluF [Sphingobium sp. EP60837]
MSLYQIMYISSAQGSVTADQCAAIARAAAVRNRLADVTGLLLFNSKRFIQVLEGPRAAVESVYERIRQDDRHRGVVKLREAAIDSREFGDWGMAYDDPAQPSANLKDKVAVLLDRAGASTRAHFMGSAEMHRG